MNTNKKSKSIVGIAKSIMVGLLVTQLAGSALASSVNLAWDANSDQNLAGYNVYRSAQSGAASPTMLNTSLVQSPALADNTAQNGSTYYYVVKAVNTDGLESAPSNEIQAVLNAPAPDPSTPMAVKYSRLAQNGGAAASSGVAVISLRDGQNVVSETSVAGSAPVTQGRLFVDVDGKANTGMAIANDNDQAVTINYYFTDEKGNDFGQGSFTMDAKSQKSMFVTEAPFNLGRQMQGTLTFNATAAVSVAALRGFINERGEFLMTTLPVGQVGVAPATESVVFPHFADGEGWMTEVVLTNPMDVTLTGKVRFYGATGQVLQMTVNGVKATVFNYTVAPRSAVKLATANGAGAVQVGSVVATAANHGTAPEGLSIFSYKSQGVTVTEAGAPAEQSGTEFRTYVESMGAVRSGLAITNGTAVAAEATIELTTLDGNATGMTATLEIPANGHVAEFITEMFPGIANGFQGVLHMTTTQAVSVVGLRLRVNDTGDLLITTMPVINEAAPAPTTDLVFPLVVNGGGYTTEFISIAR